MNLRNLLASLFLLTLSVTAYGQVPAVDDPKDEDAIYSYSRGFPTVLRLDTMRAYMAPEVDTGLIRTYIPGVNPVPAADRFKFIRAADSLIYYIDAGRRGLRMTGSTAANEEAIIRRVSDSIQLVRNLIPVVPDSIVLQSKLDSAINTRVTEGVVRVIARDSALAAEQRGRAYAAQEALTARDSAARYTDSLFALIDTTSLGGASQTYADSVALAAERRAQDSLAVEKQRLQQQIATAAAGEYFVITASYLAGLPNAPKEVYVNNGVTFTANTTIADSVKLRFGPSGYLTVTAGSIVTLGREYEAPAYQWIFRGNGRYLQKKLSVYLTWFGATADGVVDVADRWAVISGGTAANPFKHAVRQAKYAMDGQRDWEIRVPAGLYIGNDASQAVRSAYAGGTSEVYYRENEGSLSAYERLYNNGVTTYEVVDNGGFILEDGAVVVPPNNPANTTYWAVDLGLGYRDTNWDYDLVDVATYDTTSATLNSRVFQLKTAADAAVWVGRRKAFLSGGASYGDQQHGEQLLIDSVVGLNVHLNQPLALDYFPSRNSHYGDLNASFTQPAVGSNVQVNLSKSPPVGPKGKYFSIGNDLYELISSDGGTLYTIRNIGKGNKAAGTVIPTGTKAYFRRVLIHTPGAPENFYVRGSGPGSIMVGRRDLIRSSNLFNSTVENMTLVYAKQGTDVNGLWLNADGYRGLNLRNLIVYSVSGRTEVGQAARSGTGLLIENVQFRDISLELTEFSKLSTLRGVVFDVDTIRAPFKPKYKNAALHVGATTAATVLEDVTFNVSNCDNAIGNSDIGEYGATSGGGILTSGVLMRLHNVQTGVNVGPAGADLRGISMSGNVRDLFGSVGGSPKAGTGSTTGMSYGSTGVVWSRGGPTNVGLDFVGNFDRVFGNYSSYAVGTVNASRIKSYNGANIPSNFSQDYGIVFHRDGFTGKPLRIQLTANLANFPLGLDSEIKYPGNLSGPNDYIRINCTQCPIYNTNETYTGITKDTTICVGGGCTSQGAIQTENTTDEIQIPIPTPDGSGFYLQGREDVIVPFPTGSATDPCEGAIEAYSDEEAAALGVPIGGFYRVKPRNDTGLPAGYCAIRKQ
ncbi:hypothetical protein [Lewinella sp. JB7]|uniref:hypothetical protein n=1 Tax=Lewinella sp. JB7 TaxID=2962887 RepID=UPI0020C98081|nr:hypothetical protein [Lewinella sp. JB7]MCP9237162.1 hypothetical protein [Lewinella sp. JB7]